MRWSQDEVLSILMNRILSGDRDLIETISHWEAKPSNMEGERIFLRDEDAQPLIEAGFLYKNTNGAVGYLLTQLGVKRACDLIGRIPMDVGALLKATLDTILFNPSKALDGGTAIPAIYVPGTSKLVLVLGENAGGKSMFRRIIHQMTNKGRRAAYGDPAVPRGPFPVGEMIGLSMQGRTSGGMSSSFIYGTESYNSTGQNSAQTVEMGIKTACERTNTNILYWDEPDIGMSGGACAGTGITIRDFILNGDAPLVEAVFLTSHSPILIKKLIETNPHYIFLGNADGPRTIQDWLVWQEDPPPIVPSELSALSHKRFKAIQAVLNAASK